MYIPIWVIVLTLLTAAIAVILWQQGKKPSDWYERLIEIMGKPYVIWVIGFAGSLLCLAYWFYLKDVIISVHNMVKNLKEESGLQVIHPETISNLATGSAVLLGALVAATGLAFTLIKVWINERTTSATEEGLITDRINAAVASLAAEKTIKEDEKERTIPNIEVRIGAILALERMAKKNADVHIQIMEILTAYIRENAPVTEEEHDRKPRHDIQLAFTVIGRRPPNRITLERMHDFRLDLRNCDLTGIDGQELDFENAQFENARLKHAELSAANMQNAELCDANIQNAYLWDANLQNAYLWDANLQGAELRNVNMQNTDLGNANLQGADLRNANLQGADLRNVNMQNADLGNANMQNATLENANMQNTDLGNANMENTDLGNANMENTDLGNANMENAALWGANMQYANLWDANLQNADLRDANLQNAHLRDVNMQNAKNLTDAFLRGASVRLFDFTDLPISQDQIDEMFGDGSVTLPDSITWPSHWPKEELSDDEFHTKWEEWKKTLPPVRN